MEYDYETGTYADDVPAAESVPDPGSGEGVRA